MDDPFVRIISLVSQQRLRLETGQKRIGTLQIAGLTRGQNEIERVAQGVDPCVDFGTQSALGSPDSFLLANIFGFLFFFYVPRQRVGGRAQSLSRSWPIRCRHQRRTS